MTINDINNEIEKLKDSNLVDKSYLLLDYRRIKDNKIFITSDASVFFSSVNI